MSDLELEREKKGKLRSARVTRFRVVWHDESRHTHLVYVSRMPSALLSTSFAAIMSLVRVQSLGEQLEAR